MIFDNNDRQDIQLANDRAIGVARDNHRNRVLDQEIAAEQARAWGDEESGAASLSEVITKLIEDGGGRWLRAKSAIYQDFDINDIVDHIAIQACIIPDGWDEPITDQNQVEILLQDRGCTVEITVILH
jgi:hypothetical protein